VDVSQSLLLIGAKREEKRKWRLLVDATTPMRTSYIYKDMEMVFAILVGWLVAVVFYNMENYREQTTTIAATDE
jgi:hypothetical protein